MLNAFRHHGIDHTYPTQSRRTGTQVLNAFRHHGIDHTLPPNRLEYVYLPDLISTIALVRSVDPPCETRGDDLTLTQIADP